MGETYIGLKYRQRPEPEVITGFHDPAGILTVVDETNRSVALRSDYGESFSLTWVLKDDLVLCLDRVGEE